MKKTLELDFSNKASNVSISDDIVTKIWGSGLNWSKSDAEAVLADHTQYLADLRSINFRASDILARGVVQDTDGYFVIKESEAYSGTDLAATILGAADKTALVGIVTKGFELTAKAMLAIPPKDGTQYSADQPWFCVPVDIIPQNVVIRSDANGFIFIDTFAPLLWSGDTIKPLPVKLSGENPKELSAVKFGDIRFSLGRLNGYMIALCTRWLVNKGPKAQLVEIDTFRAEISDELIRITRELLSGNEHFEASYAQLLINDASEPELRSIEHGDYEGPRYVQSVYENQVEANIVKPAR